MEGLVWAGGGCAEYWAGRWVGALGDMVEKREWVKKLEQVLEEAEGNQRVDLELTLLADWRVNAEISQK